MSTNHGNDGTMYVGANVFAELASYSYREEAAVADDSVLGDTWDTHIANKATKRWSGEAVAKFDPSDTNGQEALVVGASVTLNFYPQGNSAGKGYRYGIATVMTVAVAIGRTGAIERSFTFQGNGALNSGSV